MSICCPRLRSALVRMTEKAVKVYSASAANSARQCQSNDFKSNQSRRSLAFTDAEGATKRQINKRERGKMFSQLFYERNVK